MIDIDIKSKREQLRYVASPFLPHDGIEQM